MLRELFHYIGQEEHYTNAKIIMMIILMMGMLLGMTVYFIISVLANKKYRNGKFSGSLDDLVDSVNGVRGWKPKSQIKK